MGNRLKDFSAKQESVMDTTKWDLKVRYNSRVFHALPRPRREIYQGGGAERG